MKKSLAIAYVYEIAMLIPPSGEVIEMLNKQDFERALELIMIMRRTNKIKSPANFLRRAIEEGWKPETLPQKVDRRMQRILERHYIRKGFDEQTAREKALKDAAEG